MTIIPDFLWWLGRALGDVSISGWNPMEGWLYEFIFASAFRGTAARGPGAVLGVRVSGHRSLLIADYY